jgi:aerobic carbon-monoxide dehydrogenase medium subunit
VYPSEFEYFAPRTVDEAIELLGRYGDEAKVLAGGQSLVPMMKLRIASPRYLVDINRIPGLADLRRDGDRLVIGALCRHADVGASQLVRGVLPIMVDVASLTADVQVRNRGTVAGSVAHADPSGDWPAVLAALDTTVDIAGPAGLRTVPLGEFIVDTYTTQLEPTEIVVGLSVGLPRQPAGGAYVKFEKRAGDFAVASVGVQMELKGETCANIAISLGALGPTALRVPAAEDALRGRPMSDALTSQAETLVREAAQPFADTRGSVEYKRHLAGVLFRHALQGALARAQGTMVETIHL